MPERSTMKQSVRIQSGLPSSPILVHLLTKRLHLPFQPAQKFHQAYRGEYLSIWESYPCPRWQPSFPGLVQGEKGSL